MRSAARLRAFFVRNPRPGKPEVRSRKAGGNGAGTGISTSKSAAGPAPPSNREKHG
jgi:hypothetical protein